MKKIIIFGATGNIGMYFTDYCNKNLDPSEFQVIAVGRKKTNYFSERGIEYINLDLCNPTDFDKLPDKDVYAIFNLAGILPAYYQEYDPFKYVEVNINGSLRILEYARKNKVDRVIYTQTWSELAGYWGKEEILRADLPRKLKFTGDHAFYSITKSMIADTMEYYKQEFGVKNFVFRLPNVYLYSPEMYYFVDGIKKPIGYRYLIERATKGENIELWGNPYAFKDILYVKDLCQMMIKTLYTDISGGTYNAGTGCKTTLREQIEGIVEVFSPKNRKSNIIQIDGSDAFTSFVMDIDNLKNDLGYEPKYTYLEYLEDYKWERESNRFFGLWS